MLCLVTGKVRLICGDQWLDHTSILFYDLRILKLPDMVNLKTAEIMYKAFNNSIWYASTNPKTMCISINGVKIWNSFDS